MGTVFPVWPPTEQNPGAFVIERLHWASLSLFPSFTHWTCSVDVTWCCIAALDKGIKKIHHCPSCTLWSYLIFLIFWGGKPATFCLEGPPFNITWLQDVSFDTGIHCELNMTYCIIKPMKCRRRQPSLYRCFIFVYLVNTFLPSCSTYSNSLFMKV